MKKAIVRTILVALFLVGFVSTASAMDKAGFKEMAKDTIRQALSGSISDIDGLIAQQEKLVAIGVQGCREYAKASPKDAKLMNFVADNAEKMKAMTLDEIEAAWHDGEALKEIGLDFDSIEHFGAALSHMDTVVHPATTYIALKKYKETKDEDLLEQVKDELSEVLEHLTHVD